MSPKRFIRLSVEAEVGSDEEVEEALVRALRRLRLPAAEQEPEATFEVVAQETAREVVAPAAVRGAAGSEVPAKDRCVALKRGSEVRCSKRRSGARFCPSHYDWEARGGSVINDSA